MPAAHGRSRSPASRSLDTFHASFCWGVKRRLIGDANWKWSVASLAASPSCATNARSPFDAAPAKVPVFGAARALGVCSVRPARGREAPWHRPQAGGARAGVEEDPIE